MLRTVEVGPVFILAVNFANNKSTNSHDEFDKLVPQLSSLPPPHEIIKGRVIFHPQTSSTVNSHGRRGGRLVIYQPPYLPTYHKVFHLFMFLFLAVGGGSVESSFGTFLFLPSGGEGAPGGHYMTTYPSQCG